MANLTVDLREGFSNQPVKILVDNNVVFDKQSVNTDYSIGLAESFQLQTEDDTIWLQASLPLENIEKKILVNVSVTPYIGIGVSDKSIVFTSSTEPFVYF